ncbi:MAG: hypothetical protein CMC22_08765 [Flavobacteriaceae bacterium]|nr:hypothetical protein [Flavobacteriaceae bacterium]|tara:strand:- start:1604 stop:2248 length:645 start_codon:yes stop_codon:yes gene_type:complete
MKFYKYFLLLIIGFIALNTWAQTSIEAKNLIELASKQMESYENIQFEFNYELNNRMEKINQDSSGKVTVSGKKYKLNFLDAIQLFDGKALYTIVTENKEITITQEGEDGDFGINPKKLLQFHKEGYDFYWDISQKVRGKNIQFIKLLPTQDEDGIKSLLVGIDTKLNHIYKLIEVGDNGTVTTLTIEKMEVNVSLTEDFFFFNEADYPDYYINN